MEGPIRYVLTHLKADGARTLTEPRQGRYTYATEAEAAERLGLFKESLREKVLGDRADTLEVRMVECYPDHFDPKTCWFD